MAPKTAIHGLRRPLASAMAPSTGESAAIASPAPLAAKPQSAWPCAGSAAIAAAKYGAYTNVVSRVKNGVIAHSASTQPAIARREPVRFDMGAAGLRYGCLARSPSRLAATV